MPTSPKKIEPSSPTLDSSLKGITSVPPFPTVQLEAGEILVTGRAVTWGQLDKLCDLIVDSIVAKCLKDDPAAKCNLTCAIKSRMLVLFGEVQVKGTVDFDGTKV